MAKKLKVTVQVFDEESNTYKSYGPGDDVPDSVAKSITNPDVWDDGKDEEETEVPGPGQFSVPDEKAAPKKAAAAPNTGVGSK